MKKITYHHELTPFSSRLMDRYFGGMKIGVFDIETLGLNPAQSEVILAGFLAVHPDGSAVVTQYFAEERQDEPQLLHAIFDEFRCYDCLLTYNGRHFDLPFVNKRAEILELDIDRSGCYNLDLYLILHGHSSLKSVIGNLKQKNVEDYMGLNVDRKDEISGADSILLYEEFLTECDLAQKEVLKQKVLLHNHDDLLQLYRILPIIRQTDIHRAMSYLGFPVTSSGDWPQLNIGRIRADYKGLTVTGTYGGPGISYTSYDNGMMPFSCHFSPEGTFEFLFYTRRHRGSHYIQLDCLLDEARLQSLSRYPAYVNGCLILTEDNQTNFLEVNMFTQAFLSRFTETTICPV